MLVHERLPQEVRHPRAGGSHAGFSGRGPGGLIHLQAMAGNAAVTSLVQRCGPSAPGCGCSPAEKDAAQPAPPAPTAQLHSSEETTPETRA